MKPEDDNKDQDQGFDKERQRADQAEANARKAREELNARNQELDKLRTEQEELRSQLGELTTKKDAATGIASLIPDVSPDDANAEDLANANTALKKVLTDIAQEVASLKSKTEKSEKQQTEAARRAEIEKRQNETLNRVCTEFESEYGKGTRNAALKLMSDMNEQQGEPDSPADAFLRLRSCFKTVSEKKASGHDLDADTDLGGGGGRPLISPKTVKPGSLDDVASQYASAG